MKKKIFGTIFILVVIFSFIFSKFISENKITDLKKNLSPEIKIKIKKIFLPYKYISELDVKIKNYDFIVSVGTKQKEKLSLWAKRYPPQNSELEFKKSNRDIMLQEKKSFSLDNNLILYKYNILNGFDYGISNSFPGSGFFEFYNDNLFIISATGIIGYSKNFSQELRFKQIKNNIDDFINLNQFNKDNWFSIKDLHISNDKIFVSFTDEIKENCFNTSIISGKLEYEQIKFEKFFSSKECIDVNKGKDADKADQEFNGHQSAGKIISLDNDEILFSVGDYRLRELSQNLESINGKIIKINTGSKDNYEILSMGHRNAQGLFYDKENNFIISTEHGPQGGDEINIINIVKEKITNYGWPIASYGEHYGGKVKRNERKYEKYPLLKSHKDNGFIEPIKYFDPSIAISAITADVKNKTYIVASMKDINGEFGGAIHFFDLDDKNQINNFNSVDINERVRDIIYKDGILYLFLEDTASIGIINLL